MKAALPLLALVIATPALAQDAGAITGQMLELNSSVPLDYSQARILAAPAANCDDTVQLVQQGRWLPLVDRNAADADAPILINAVDYTVDGCAMMRTRAGEIRSLPLVPEGPVQTQPAQ